MSWGCNALKSKKQDKLCYSNVRNPPLKAIEIFNFRFVTLTCGIEVPALNMSHPNFFSIEYFPI